ncbi:hypothetical protein ACV07N_00975 [Roseivirga echinicomitans]
MSNSFFLESIFYLSYIKRRRCQTPEIFGIHLNYSKMEMFKKMFGASALVAVFTVMGLASFSNQAEANPDCKIQTYEDIYCSATGCGNVGFDTCVSPNVE